MATTTHLVNPYVSIATVDFTDQCQSATLTVGYDSLEATAFGDTGRRYVKGLQSVNLTLTMYESFGASELEAKLADLIGDGDTTVVIGANGSVTPSATNPVYTLTNTMLASFTPINGTYGTLASIDVTFTGGTFARATT